MAAVLPSKQAKNGARNEYTTAIRAELLAVEKKLKILQRRRAAIRKRPHTQEVMARYDKSVHRIGAYLRR